MKQFLPAFALLLATQLPAQKAFFVRNGCAVDKTEMGADHYVFDPSSEAARIIKSITDANFLQPNFIIKSGDVENALATLDGGQRYIIYNTSYIERIKTSAGSDWAAFFVFAHEIGHHLNHHRFDIDDPARRKEQELEADLFAGGMLYRLGARLDEAQAGVTAACNELGSSTHPPRRARIEAVANGWKRAKEQSPVQPGRMVIEEEADPPPAKADNMVFIRGGTFQMGSTDGEEDEQPVHTVTVSDFYLGKYEVTVAEFRAFVEATGHNTDAEKAGTSWGLVNNEWKEVQGRNWRHDPEGNRAQDNHPVINVSWNDAVAYCQWLSKKTGQTYRLPTEAEWEYAAGNGSRHTKYSWGDVEPLGRTPGNLAVDTVSKWYGRKNKKGNKPITLVVYYDDYISLAPVGSFDANDFHLYDMTGNVLEWCSDWYEVYLSSNQINPSGPDSGSYRVIRGGSWVNVAKKCRVAGRGSSSPSNRYSDIGFRLARSR
ncbi:MAG: SUMF1/EgtB/PvdO family nonheme iron enzyme [Saprospiraceae bacterium]|nr:SUMF1/EgtB/PvdO family nonheme iron enzyme [Saprospiraceae bacterium]